MGNVLTPRSPRPKYRFLQIGKNCSELIIYLLRIKPYSISKGFQTLVVMWNGVISCAAGRRTLRPTRYDKKFLSLSYFVVLHLEVQERNYSDITNMNKRRSAGKPSRPWYVRARRGVAVASVQIPEWPEYDPSGVSDVGTKQPLWQEFPCSLNFVTYEASCYRIPWNIVPVWSVVKHHAIV